MNVNRRDFLFWTACVASGCPALLRAAETAEPRVVSAGPVGDYAADGVYSRFRDQGFFIIRNGDKLFALSAICTHRRFKLEAEPDHTFHCKRHGSTFNPTGKVTEGPARRDLPVLATFTDAKGNLNIQVPV